MNPTKKDIERAAALLYADRIGGTSDPMLTDRLEVVCKRDAELVLTDHYAALTKRGLLLGKFSY